MSSPFGQWTPTLVTQGVSSSAPLSWPQWLIPGCAKLFFSFSFWMKVVENYLFSLFCRIIHFCLQNCLLQCHISQGEGLRERATALGKDKPERVLIPFKSLALISWVLRVAVQSLSFCGCHRSGGDQDTLPPNLATSPIEYIKPKELRNSMHGKDLLTFPWRS